MNFGQLGPRPASARRPIWPAGGYLTPVSGTPVISADALNVSTLFYAHDTHNGIPIMRGGQFEMVAFEEPQIPLSGLAANGIYDLVAIDGRSNPRFGFAPAWQSAAVGASARGSGLGFNELITLDGVRVNRYPIQVLTRSGTVSVGEKKATLLASVAISAVAGVTNFHLSYGQSRFWPVSNVGIKRQIYLKAGDSSSTWSYGGALRAANGNSANSATVLSAIADEYFQVDAISVSDTGNVGASAALQTRNGIGFNVSNVRSGSSVANAMAISSSISSLKPAMVSKFTASPSLGLNSFILLEENLGSGVPTWSGGESNNVITVFWRG